MFTPVRLDDPTPTSLSRGGALAITGLAAQGILRFATSLLVGRIAGQAELGVVASAIAAATILALLWPTSTGSAASKFLARARGAGSIEEARATAAHLRRRMLATVLLLAAAAIPVWVYLDGGSLTGALAVALLTIGYSGYSFTRGVQFGTGQTTRATGWDVLCVVLGLVVLTLLLLSGVRGVALVLPLALAYGVYALAGWPFGGGGRPEPTHRRELDGFVALGAVGSLASAGFLQLSQIVARLVSGDAGAGEYAAALALATPASMLAVSLTLVLLPALSETLGRSDEKAFRTRTDHATRTLAVVVVMIFGAVALCSRLLIRVIWGADYAGAAPILAILAVAVLCTNLGVVAVNALTARSQRGMAINVAASLTGMGFGTVVWLVAAPKLGGVGVALGYLAGTFVIAAIPVVVVWRAGRHRWAGLYAKLAGGILLLVALYATQSRLVLPIWLDPAVAVVFAVVWVALNRADAARLPRPWRSRRN
ncbi:lipopolysaccharide biosynthesis protein [Pseudonocardia parietis]|uniref:Peptidoglycan lipid II flippase n=1 Tax=Pseudonocardia parietis TaxID=570936 RepID=A0ABS4VL85_9PSEU|nr:lipid II flippase MurJ [Pseudonocardia parietis]MBP2364686.1 putative peptidoglycan lipid II flippase [Pseudonocardia parietis]